MKIDSHTKGEPSLQTLQGTLERVTYQNEENGYTVARIVPEGKSYEITAVGTLAGINVGESLQLRGVWTSHPRYGRQFEVSAYSVELPATVSGIRKYLGSGLIKGIGPVTAKRIVQAFGLETLDIIETDIERLRDIAGVGPKRAAMIADAWEEQKQIKEVMVFLQSHGVSTGLAVKIYKHYGEAAINVVRSAPYQLARDIYGIGFRTADKIARNIGIEVDAPERVQAGLRYALGTFSDDGHCYADREALLAAAAELLDTTVETCREQLDALVEQEDVIDVETDGTYSHSAIYLPPFFFAEQGVASKIQRLQTHPRDRLRLFREVDWDRAFDWLENQQPIQLAPEQRTAIRMALTQPVSILTGGPGTGKSTIMGSLITLARAKGRTVLLAAPTGRAAKRLSETTELPARTIHRLLEFKPGPGTSFLRDRDNPLDTDLVIVDEASMIDILLMNHLLKAIEAGTHLLLVGDVDQLPSVGPGNVLKDIIDSGTVPVTRLETIFRQSEASTIVVNAHRINQGQPPILTSAAEDFFFFGQPDPQRAASLLIDIVARRIPAKFGYDPGDDIQVLSPMHRGVCGVSALNSQLQTRLNPTKSGDSILHHGARNFRVGDRVMQIRNDYDRQIFNGDMGQVNTIDLEDRLVTVDFEGKYVGYEVSQLDELVHAYAVSIHKSQGSEFTAVVIPILTQHYVMLQRNLLYTAITRARELVVLVGDRRAIAIAVGNNRIAHRNTDLAARLVEKA